MAEPVDAEQQHHVYKNALLSETEGISPQRFGKKRCEYRIIRRMEEKDIKVPVRRNLNRLPGTDKAGITLGRRSQIYINREETGI